VTAFFSASGPALSQEAADSKINAQSVCALNMVYMGKILLNLFLGFYCSEGKIASDMITSNVFYCTKLVDIHSI
jgi:hypothetical protein